ncbi:component of the polarisome [Ceratobasidium sp. 428]|nr:component of the polarisome [Ceratobasidium sp. 428]
MRQASRDQGVGAGAGAGSGSDRRRPSQDDYGVRRRPSEDETRRQPSVDAIRRRPSGDEGPYRRPSQDAQVGRRPSQDKPAGTASSSYVTPNKSTIVEEVIQVPYGRDEGTEDEDEDDRNARRPSSDEDPSRHSKKPSQGGLNALGFSLLSTPLSPTSDDGALPNGLNGRAASDYYEKMSFGRASVSSSQGGGGGERRNTEIEDVRREYEFKIATMQSKLSALEDKARSESERARTLENDARGATDRERELRRTLSERDAEIRKLDGELVRVRERCEQLEEDLQDAQSGQPNGASCDAGNEQLRREMQSLLEELREIAASRDDMVAERDADTQTIRELSSQMQEYKRKYEAAKTELRGLKATSQLYVQQPANIVKQDQLPISERGGIVDIHITAFQSAMDTMLMAARQVHPYSNALN